MSEEKINKKEADKKSKEDKCSGMSCDFLKKHLDYVIGGAIIVALVITLIFVIVKKDDNGTLVEKLSKENIEEVEEEIRTAFEEKEMFSDEVEIKFDKIIKEEDLYKANIVVDGEKMDVYASDDYSKVRLLKGKKVSKKVAKKVEDVLDLNNAFINIFFKPGTVKKVTLDEVRESNLWYNIYLTIDNKQEMEVHLTKDYVEIIPQTFDLEVLYKDFNKDKNQLAEVKVKSDKPVVELFVMSHCPYGTQVEKGILPVSDVLGDSIDMQLKFVDYAMHGETEIKEQMRQYCIQENEPNKFNDYLKCFLSGKAGTEDEAKACMSGLQINEMTLVQCERRIDAEYKIVELLNDKSTWSGGRFPLFNVHKIDGEKYGVGGSPTLVINGEKIEGAGRDSASLLNTICSAFNNAPEACNEELSSDAPAPGFGMNKSSSGADTAGAECGV